MQYQVTNVEAIDSTYEDNEFILCLCIYTQEMKLSDEFKQKYQNSFIPRRDSSAVSRSQFPDGGAQFISSRQFFLF